jgi:hypothetical protein
MHPGLIITPGSSSPRAHHHPGLIITPGSSSPRAHHHPGLHLASSFTIARRILSYTRDKALPPSSCQRRSSSLLFIRTSLEGLHSTGRSSDSVASISRSPSWCRIVVAQGTTAAAGPEFRSTMSSLRMMAFGGLLPTRRNRSFTYSWVSRYIILGRCKCSLLYCQRSAAPYSRGRASGRAPGPSISRLSADTGPMGRTHLLPQGQDLCLQTVSKCLVYPGPLPLALPRVLSCLSSYG